MKEKIYRTISEWIEQLSESAIKPVKCPYCERGKRQEATTEDLIKIIKKHMPKEVKCECGKTLWLCYYDSPMAVILGVNNA